ncbi:NCA2/nuclear control of ATPase [Blumeria hordei DH14]|uniref:NCA2/nuclear control of ATPase n=1 Tax=Blumeria graminis f. sp. hordei (strain DH14) TaxID=546991 RepID=N1JBP1_BLUG1|nr:NCA2/nuclear control of ATPase [Blumeria hordei DH14]
MSIIIDQVRHVESQLNHIFGVPCIKAQNRFEISKTFPNSPQLSELEKAVRILSLPSSNSLLSSSRILNLLQQTALPDIIIPGDEQNLTELYENELQWLVVSKATVQVYGIILDIILDQTIPFNQEIWYWDKVLGSYTYSSLFALQTFPKRLWSWAKEIFHDTKHHLSRPDGSSGFRSSDGRWGDLLGQWKKFYTLVWDPIEEKSFASLQRRILSPIEICRASARRNQTRLKRLRELGASGIGMLMDEGLNFESGDDISENMEVEGSYCNDWKIVIERTVALMSGVLTNISSYEMGVTEFEETVFARVEDHSAEASCVGDEDAEGVTRPEKISLRLQHILKYQIPEHILRSQKVTRCYSRPSRLVRYWLPTSAFLLFSTLTLKLLVDRKDQIVECVQNFGETVRDFLLNWVLDPVKKLIGTIRHDPNSELAIISKESLKGDRESLEQMVVEFAMDNPQFYGSATSLSEAQVCEIRGKVREGDLTPVLRAYERNIRRPFKGTVRGDLIRTLLIQVQKTKVDVEIALSGIDALLKSQELVFGFLGLTPGSLICFASIRYLRSFFGNKRGSLKGHMAEQTLRVLRKIDRILAEATPLQENVLSYRDHGLLLCEIHVMRRNIRGLFPAEIAQEFLEDVRDLSDINRGFQAQLKALDRIKWGYAKWLQ